MKKHQILQIILIITLLPIIKYGFEFLPTTAENSSWYYGFFSLILITILLALPYSMIILLDDIMKNHEEMEIYYRDLQGDNDQ